MLLEWKDAYSVKNKKLDSDHKKLFELADKAYICAKKDVTEAAIKSLLVEFFDYMKVHFSYEEGYMAQIGYPNLSEHIKIHRDITAQMWGLVNSSKSINELKENLFTITKSWLLDHILQQDTKIEKWHANNKDVIAFYDYICGCPNEHHKISHRTHLALLKGDVITCPICNEKLVYRGDECHLPS